jgi:hypothetical protein
MDVLPLTQSLCTQLPYRLFLLLRLLLVAVVVAQYLLLLLLLPAPAVAASQPQSCYKATPAAAAQSTFQPSLSAAAPAGSCAV